MCNIKTPCHIINLDRLRSNIERVIELKRLSGCKVLYALKGLSDPFILPYIKDGVDGVSAGSLHEILIGYNNDFDDISIYSPAYREDEIDRICRHSNKVIFNSLQQLDKYKNVAERNNCDVGLRINIEFSKIWQQGVNPCEAGSHLGIPISTISTDYIADRLDGLLVHSLCEQYDDALEELIKQCMNKLDTQLKQVKWINLGGGHLVGSGIYNIDNAADNIKKLQDKYGIQVIIEPCEGVLWKCGYFATRILDIIHNEAKVAIMDASPICHMQDAVFRGWRRDIVGKSGNGKHIYKLSGMSCFAGDSFGNYKFESELNIGDIIYFEDTATYTMVKNMKFNGIQEPSIYTYSELDGIQLVK